MTPYGAVWAEAVSCWRICHRTGEVVSGREQRGECGGTVCCYCAGSESFPSVSAITSINLEALCFYQQISYCKIWFHWAVTSDSSGINSINWSSFLNPKYFIKTTIVSSLHCVLLLLQSALMVGKERPVILANSRCPIRLFFKSSASFQCSLICSHDNGKLIICQQLLYPAKAANSYSILYTD